VARVDVHRWEVVGLLVYSAVLGIALLSPSSRTQSGMAGWLTAARLTQPQAEFVGNVLIVVPVSLIGSLLWTRTTWRTWTAVAFAGACAVEVAQGLLLPHRTPSATDVVANTLGGLAGSLVVLGVRWSWRRRRGATR
jgi:VanZ like protein